MPRSYTDDDASDRSPYPWHIVVRNGADDQHFYEALVACLDGELSLAPSVCTGFCTGRCAQPATDETPLALNGVRVVGRSASSRLFRHRVHCGTVPIFVMPTDVMGITSDTFASRFGTFCGFEATWAPVDRKTWHLQHDEVHHKYSWSIGAPEVSIAKPAPYISKHMYCWKLRSTYTDPHPLVKMCHNWKTGAFAAHVAGIWELTTWYMSASLQNDMAAAQATLEGVLADRYHIRVRTLKGRQALQSKMAWVWALQPPLSLTKRIERVVHLVPWTIDQLVMGFTRFIHTLADTGSGTLSPDACATLVRACDMNAEATRALLACDDLLPAPMHTNDANDGRVGVRLSVVLLHVKCLLHGRSGIRLPLKKTVVTDTRSAAAPVSSYDECATGVEQLCNQQIYIERCHEGGEAKRQRASACTVVYYELTDDWETGTPELDERLWAVCTYTPPQATAATTATTTDALDTTHTAPTPPPPRRYRAMRSAPGEAEARDSASASPGDAHALGAAMAQLAI